MKSKLMIASLLLAGACAANLNAQEKTNYYTPKWSDNIFVSVGGGIHAINNDGFNKIAPHFSVSVGKLITPTWGVRAQVNGITQHLCLDDAYWEHNKTYVGGNIDAMINLSTLFGTYTDHLDFVLEGGSIESDGHGTLLTTSECLLSANRNDRLNRADIEERLKAFLHVERILWLDHGYLSGDDTDSHIDTLARFCPDQTIAYVKCEDRKDEHYEALARMEEQLRTFRTLQGTPYRLVALPMPEAIFDEDGQRLPATYANFLVVNGAVLMPTYHQPALDEQARKALQKAFPQHEVVGIDCRPLIRQHGSLHCCTMQFPVPVLK